jgi:site-specific DNA-methyltransferase (adenine-specific)
MKRVPIEDIKPNPKNPRTISSASLKKLVKSIKDFPEMLDLRPIVVTEDMTILGGNMRYKAAVEAGIKELPIVIAELSDDQQKEFIIKDNVGFGEWDWNVLMDDDMWVTEDLTDWGLVIPDENLPKKEVKEDNYEIPDNLEPKTKPGDLIEIGPHKLLCGSATSPEDIDKLLEGKLVDMVFTDSPYNVDYKGGTGLKIQNDNMSSDNFYHFLFDFYSNMERTLKPGSPFYIWHADREVRNFVGALQDVGNLYYSQTIYWYKSQFVLGRADYHYIHEPCLYGWKKGESHKWYGDRKQTTVNKEEIKELDKMTKAELLVIAKSAIESRPHTTFAEFEKPSRSELHPTMKPIKLCEYYIENSSQKGDLVMDFFLGSGSTMVAAHQMGRVCYGTELDPVYCDVIIDRMKTLDPNIDIKINGVPLS